MKFSQRHGYSPARKLVQLEGVDEELRAGLWSALILSVWNAYRRPGSGGYGRSPEVIRGTSMHSLVQEIWIEYYKAPVDTIPRLWPECLKLIRDRFFNYQWFQVLDFVEFIAQHKRDNAHFFIDACNTHFEKENSGYRFVSLQIVPISSNAEIVEVAEAADRADSFLGASEHISTALRMLADRENPDYRNTIKESISAVESVAKEIANDRKATLGQVLKHLERSRGLHPSLKSGFSSLYGFTSDESGIRHAILESPSVTRADAKFMLVACSAFVNFLIEHASTESGG